MPNTIHSEQKKSATWPYCRLRLGDLSSHYGAGFGVNAIADLVVKAIHLPGAMQTIQATMTASESEVVEKECRAGFQTRQKGILFD